MQELESAGSPDHATQAEWFSCDRSRMRRAKAVHSAPEPAAKRRSAPASMAAAYLAVAPCESTVLADNIYGLYELREIFWQIINLILRLRTRSEPGINLKCVIRTMFLDFSVVQEYK